MLVGIVMLCKLKQLINALAYVVTKVQSDGNTMLFNLEHALNVLENDVLFAADVGITTTCKDRHP
jgi:hypothetical protein